MFPVINLDFVGWFSSLPHLITRGHMNLQSIPKRWDPSSTCISPLFVAIKLGAYSHYSPDSPRRMACHGLWTCFYPSPAYFRKSKHTPIDCLMVKSWFVLFKSHLLVKPILFFTVQVSFSLLSPYYKFIYEKAWHILWMAAKSWTSWQLLVTFSNYETL